MPLTPAGTALIGVGIGAVATSLGGFLSRFSQRGQRRHDRAMAVDARRQADLRSVHPEWMWFVISEVERTRRTIPIIGPAPEPPPVIEEPAAEDLQSRIYAYASEPVKEAIERFLTLRTDFFIGIAEVHQLKALQEGGRIHGVDSPIKHRKAADDHRQKAIALMDELRILVRDELASGSATPSRKRRA